MEKLEDCPGPPYKPNKVLYLCFGEYSQIHWADYFIQAIHLENHAPQLMAESHMAAPVLVGFVAAPVLVGFGVYGSNIILAGGIQPQFDGLQNFFIADPCRDVYVFDTANMSLHVPDVRQPLQHGKTQSLVVEHEGNLYALSLLKGEGFGMFDPKLNTWVTLPEPPFFHKRHPKHPTNCVVVGNNIFVSSLSSIFRFDMADTSQTWKEHSFTNCTALPYVLDENSLALEMSDGNWLIFSCSIDTDKFKDEGCCDEYDCNSSDEDYPPYPPRPEPVRWYKWKGTTLLAYVMSKDFTSLTPIPPLPLCNLPTKPSFACCIDYRIVHLGGQDICVILSIDKGLGFIGDAKRKMRISMVSLEFQLSESKDLLTIKPGSYSRHRFLLDAKSSNATKISLYGAFWL